MPRGMDRDACGALSRAGSFEYACLDANRIDSSRRAREMSLGFTVPSRSRPKNAGQNKTAPNDTRVAVTCLDLRGDMGWVPRVLRGVKLDTAPRKTYLGVLGQQRKAFVIEIVPVLAAHRGRTFEHERSLDVGPREEWRIRSTHWFSMSGASSRRTHAGARFGEGESPGGGRLGRAPCSDARRVRNRTSPRAETNHGT